MEKYQEFEAKTAQEILKWASFTFGEKIAVASSFGAEDVVLIDIWVKLRREEGKEPRIFTIDTGRLPQETYDVIDVIMQKYKIDIDFYFPDPKDVEAMLKEHGPNLFYRSVELRRLCCNIRKVKPLNRALQELDAWICGLRREQSVTRTAIKKVEEEEREIAGKKKRIIKINPLADWSNDDVWNYIKENDVPYNKLHDKNYLSIGCLPCTRAVKPGEDIRAGRWWWESPEYKECGLHPAKGKER